MTIEDDAKKILLIMYRAIPYEQLNAWGMNRYKRFKTQAWKHIQTTENLSQFVSSFFQYYPASRLIMDITEAIDQCSDQIKVFEYLRENLVILVGRIQYEVKHNKIEKKGDDEICE